MTAGKLGAVILIFATAAIAWAILGGVTESRTSEASRDLGGAVGSLWGTAQEQAAPTVYYLQKGTETLRDPVTKRRVVRTVTS